MPKSHGMLINELAKVNENIIVVLSCGSPIKMDAWEFKAKSILNLYLGDSDLLFKGEFYVYLFDACQYYKIFCCDLSGFNSFDYTCGICADIYVR